MLGVLWRLIELVLARKVQIVGLIRFSGLMRAMRRLIRLHFEWLDGKWYSQTFNLKLFKLPN